MATSIASTRAQTGTLRTAPERSRTAPAETGFDRDYWVAHCQGYRVDAVDGRVGFVDEVRDGGTAGPLVAIRAGRLGRRVLVVATSEIAFIVPRAERIWLRSPVRLVATEPAWARGGESWSHS